MPLLTGTGAAAPVTGHWRLALIASLGMWVLIGSAIGVMVNS